MAGNTENILLNEGSSCQQLGLTGICKRVLDCPIALHALRKGKRHDLLRCGFVGAEEIVCCPDLSDRNPLIETTTLDHLTIWHESHDNKPNKTKNETPGGNKERFNARRKCEIMCEKILNENGIKAEIQFHVLNGEDAKAGQFPHMAALGFLDTNGDIDWKRCGASLISSRFLLTAAHCVVCNGCTDPVKVRLGVADIRDDQSAQDLDVKEVIISTNYNITSKHNDLAIVKLAKDVRMSKTVYPACLYTEASDPIGLVVTGWGQTELRNENSRSDILQWASVEAVPIDQCNTTIVSNNRYSAKTIITSQICAISKSDACTGDSGGPLQIEKKSGGFDIVGIVSYGIQCGTSIPGIYTRVSAYLDWIEEKVWPT